MHLVTTVKVNHQLSDLKGRGVLQNHLDWRYFEHNEVDRNELQILKNLHKGTGTKMTEKLTIGQKKKSNLPLCLTL